MFREILVTGVATAIVGLGMEWLSGGGLSLGLAINLFVSAVIVTAVLQWTPLDEWVDTGFTRVEDRW